MATPTPTKTSITLSPATRQAYELAKAEQTDLTLNEFINTAVAFYARYHDEPGFDAVVRHVSEIRKSLDALLNRDVPTPPMLPDASAIAAEVVKALRPLMPPPPVHTPWWRRRWRRQPVEHW